MASSIELIDVSGQPINIEILQNGKPPDIVRAGERARFTWRTRDPIILCINRIKIDSPENWDVSNIVVGDQAWLSSPIPAWHFDAFPPLQLVGESSTFILEVMYHPRRLSAELHEPHGADFYAKIYLAS